MRLKKSVKNIKYNLIFFIINFLFIFVSKRVFILNLGAETTGLHELFKNIIGFLNIAELGIINAVTFSLYKPIKDEDWDKINSILVMFKHLYRIIAIAIMTGAVVISIFIGFFIHESTISLTTIGIYFLIFAIVPVSSYLLTYLQVVAVVNQRSYLVIRIIGCCNIVKNIIQICVLTYAKSYIAWIIVELIFSLGGYLLVNTKIKKEYKWISFNSNKNIKELFSSNKEIFVNTKNLLFHKIGSFIVYQTDNILISSFISLRSVAIYSNYMIIVIAIRQLLEQFYNGMRASIGDLLSEGNNDKNYSIWRQLYSISIIVSLAICVTFYNIINDFISLWVGSEFLIDKFTLLCIVINLFFMLTRQVTDIFKDGYGIFWDKWAPIFEAVMNFVISIVLVQKMQIVGVVIGTNISNFLIIFIWKPYILFKEGFRKKIINYAWLMLKLSILGIASILISNWFIGFISVNLSEIALLNFFINAIIIFVIAVLITLIIFLAGDKETRNDLQKIKGRGINGF
jgi:O-antigen/teichoic acid export membrane protein